MTFLAEVAWFHLNFIKQTGAGIFPGELDAALISCSTVCSFVGNLPAEVAQELCVSKGTTGTVTGWHFVSLVVFGSGQVDF